MRPEPSRTVPARRAASGLIAIARPLAAAGVMLAAPAMLSAMSGPCSVSCCGSDVAAAAKKASASLAARPMVEVQANTYTDNTQIGASLDVSAETGHILVAWGSRRQEHGTFGVYAQLFDAAGRRVGDETHINQFFASHQDDPAVAFVGTRALIAWQSFLQDGSRGGIFARVYEIDAATGSLRPIGDEFQVNAVAAGHQADPSVAVNAAGEMLVTWTTERADGATAVVARRVDSTTGRPSGDEVLLSSDEQMIDRNASVAAAADNGFVVTFARTNLAGDPVGVFAARLDASGLPIDEALAVNAGNDGRQHIEPSIAADAAGNAVIAWMQSRDNVAEGYDVCVRRLDTATGEFTSDVVIAANDIDGWKSGAAVTVAADGRVMVSYNVMDEVADATGAQRPLEASTVFAREFTSDLRPVGDRFQVNRFDEGQQKLDIAANNRRLAWGTESNQVAVAWLGSTSNDKKGVGLTILLAEGMTAPTAEELALSTGQAAPEVPFDQMLAHTRLTDDAFRVSEIQAQVVSTEEMQNLLAVDSNRGGSEVSALIPPIWDPTFVPGEREVGIQGLGPDHGFLGFEFTGWTPPDPDIAAGPNHVVAVVNGGVAFLTKEGTLTFQTTLNDFWRPVGSQTFVFDPVALWDVYNDRFIIGATEHVGNDRHYLCLAMSDDQDPNGTWYLYRYDTGNLGDFIDFPNMGNGPEEVFITCDYFSFPTGNWIHVFDKTPMLTGAPVTLEAIRTSTSFRSLGSVNHVDSDAPAQYFATSFDSSSNVSIDAVRRDGSNNLIRSNFRVPVTRFSSPPGAQQKGTSNRAATIDQRIKNGIYRNGSLWLTHTIGENSTARVRFYEIKMNGWPTSGQNPQLVQEGTLNLGSGIHNWMADLGVDDEGNVALAYNRSSANEYISVQRASRRFYDTAGTFREGVTMQESTSPETGSRWGDYSGVDEDPAVPGTFWSHLEYRTSAWRTWVGRWSPKASMVLTAGPLFRGQAADVEVRGAADNGQVYLVYSFAGTGSTPVPQLDVTLDLASPSLAGDTTADGNGVADFSVLTIPNGAPQRLIYLQAIELGNKSNVATTQIN